MIRKSINLTLVAALNLIGSCGAFAATTSPAAGAVDAEIAIKRETGITPRQIDDVCLAAGQIVLDVDKARKDLAAKNAEGAKKIVENALESIKTIKADMPKFLVSTTVTEGKTHEQAQQIVQPLMVPLFEGLSSVGIFEPIYAAKKEAGKQPNPATAAGGKLGALVEMTASRAFLNAELASKSLEQAQKDLAAGDFAAADKSLLNVISDVVFEFDVADVPITKAQENLLLAQQAIKHNNLEKAKAALQATSAALADFEKGASTTVHKDINQLRSDIDSFANSLESEAKNANANFEKWWQTMAGWSKKTQA